MSDLLPVPAERRVVEPALVIPPQPIEPPNTAPEPTVLIGQPMVAEPPRPRIPIANRPPVVDHTQPPERKAKQEPRTTRIRRPTHVDLSKPTADEQPPQTPSAEVPDKPEPEPAEATESQLSRRRRLALAAVDSTAARRATPRDERQRGRVRVLLITGTAAGIGWALGYGPFLSASIAELGQADPKWGVGIGLLAVTGGLIVDIGLRGGRPLAQITSWSLVPATLARVPLATAVLALGLYAPGRI
ncbi:hypothetical protein ACFXDE_02010 [Kitasatospora sp. NPDC059408]|uniref:hypothetical protein n=1 Tax=Kitasatospora sp. NPDC059408 TaxID=3346823 RepID=UPI00369FEC91